MQPSLNILMHHQTLIYALNTLLALLPRRDYVFPVDLTYNVAFVVCLGDLILWETVAIKLNSNV